MKLKSAIISAALLAATGLFLETTKASSDVRRPSDQSVQPRAAAKPRLVLPARPTLRCPPHFKQTSLSGGGMGGALVCELDVNWKCPGIYNQYYTIEAKKVGSNRFNIRLVCGYIG